MKPRHLLPLALAALLGPSAAHAHRVWILPAVTVVSGNDQWISFEAAVSNNLFFPNHRPVSLSQIEVRGPDGAPVEVKNAASGEIRTSFELQLEKPGTYVVSLKPGSGRRPGGGGGGPGSGAGKAGGPGAGSGQSAQPSLFGTYEENGKVERWRGTPESLVSEGVAQKSNFKLREFGGGRRVVTFVTSGKPTTEILKPEGKDLEIDYITHPNDLFVGEPATFRLLLDGRPAAGAEVTIVRGDDRYRDEPGDTTLKAGPDGIVKIDWPVPGRYWLEATAATAGRLHGVPSEKTFTYIATFEVLPN